MCWQLFKEHRVAAREHLETQYALSFVRGTDFLRGQRYCYIRPSSPDSVARIPAASAQLRGLPVPVRSRGAWEGRTAENAGVSTGPESSVDKESIDHAVLGADGVGGVAIF